MFDCVIYFSFIFLCDILIAIKRRLDKLAIKITFGNFKGGVGKTTSSCMMSMLLSDRGFKVLHVDLDPQADSTEFLVNMYQYQLEENYNTIHDLLTKDLTTKQCVLNLKDNLDVIPSGLNLEDMDKVLIQMSKGMAKGSEYFIVDSIVAEVEEDYDFVVFDVPPAQSELGLSALVASNFVIPILQTQSKAYRQTQRYIRFVEEVQEIMALPQFNYSPVQILGVLPYLQKKSSLIDKSIIAQAKEEYEDKLFTSCILERERVKRYDAEGIDFDNLGVHDRDVFKIYNAVLDEILERCGFDEQHKTEPIC